MRVYPDVKTNKDLISDSQSGLGCGCPKDPQWEGLRRTSDEVATRSARKLTESKEV
jgi:hypothetical protein